MRPAWVALLLVGLLLLAATTSYVYPIVHPTPMLLIGHRGDMDAWPEDTLESIVAARDSSLDGMELDAQLSADGTWWVAHHRDLARATTGSGLIAETTDAELGQLTIAGGLGFDATRHVGLRLARFDEVLDALAGYQGRVIVDSKESDPETNAELARTLVDRGLADPFVICRNGAVAAAVKDVDRGIGTILLTDPKGDLNVDIWLLEGNGGFSWPSVAIADARATLGMVAVDADWDWDERPMLESGYRWGIEMTITNHPAAALAWRASVGR